MKTRSIKELLEVMLANQHCFGLGLCNWAVRLYIREYINEEEKTILYNYIQENRPSKFSNWTAFSRRKCLYWWPAGESAPRIKWIKKHIKNLVIVTYIIAWVWGYIGGNLNPDFLITLIVSVLLGVILGILAAWSDRNRHKYD